MFSVVAMWGHQMGLGHDRDDGDARGGTHDWREAEEKRLAVFLGDRLDELDQLGGRRRPYRRAASFFTAFRLITLPSVTGRSSPSRPRRWRTRASS